MKTKALRKLTIRFKSEQALKDFNKIMNLHCPKNTKELYLPEGNIKLKKSSKKIIKKEPEWKREFVDLFEYAEFENKIYASFDIFISADPADEKYIDELAEKTGNKISPLTKSFYYPKKEKGPNRSLRVSSTRGNPEFPIYVVSKTRADNCVTANYFRDMGVPYYIVVEEHQYNDYAEYHDEKHLLILDQKFLDEYDTFDNLGNTKSKGPGAARNFAWWHSTQNGYKWHWVFDDNVYGIYILEGNDRIKTIDGGFLASCEDFVKRYDNIAIAGLNYYMFVVPTKHLPPYVKNTRIYSMLLIRNDITAKDGKPFRWRGRYNEDTDLSLRVLKDGWSTVQFNAVNGDKLCTQKMKGGNTEEFYSKEGTYDKSKMIEDMHPDVAKVHWRFGRWHHYVDYLPFADNPLSKGSKHKYKKYTYNKHIFRISTEDHLNRTDTKENTYCNYLDRCSEVGETDIVLPDILPHKTPSKEKIQQGKQEKLEREEREKRAKEQAIQNISNYNKNYKGFTANENDKTYKIAVFGISSFDDYDKFKFELDEIKNEINNPITHIVNITEGNIGIFTINYAAKNSINVQDFKPDYRRNGKYAKIVEYEKISEIIDFCIIFSDGITSEFDQLIEMITDKKIQYKIIQPKISSLEEW